MITST